MPARALPPRGQRIADEREVAVTWIDADLADWSPAAEAFELVIVFYLQLPVQLRRRLHRTMAAGLAPGGTILDRRP